MSIADSNIDDLLTWFTSSYSNGAGGECVECTFTGDGALVRDSKVDDGSVIVVRSHVWHSFVRTLGQGELEN